MKKRIISLVVGLIILAPAYSQQEYAFRVLANKGANEVKSGNSWQNIKTGASLKAEDEVKVAENGYLGLVSAKGKPLEIKNPGLKKVSELLSMVQQGGASVLNKYTDFLLSSNSPEAKKNRLSATGAVHRGGVEDIKLFLPPNQSSSLYNPTAIVNWEAKGTGPFVVVLKNMWEDELMKAETPENSLEINLSDPKFANENAILIEVRSKADPNTKSESHLIKRLSPDEKEKVKRLLSDINSDVKDETALNELILAGFYEENNLFIDAITSYEKAIKLAPDVPTYKEAYEEFLLRNKMKSAK